jgi:hypothetical protein
MEDIEHALPDLTGKVYDSVVLVMRRPIPAAAEEGPSGLGAPGVGV